LKHFLETHICRLDDRIINYTLFNFPTIGFVFVFEETAISEQTILALTIETINGRGV